MSDIPFGRSLTTSVFPNRRKSVRPNGFDKVKAIKHFAQAGYSEHKIAEPLGISRKAVRNHFGAKLLNGYQGAHRLWRVERRCFDTEISQSLLAL